MKMERLTTRCNGRPALAQGLKERFTEQSLFFMLLNRLTAYEDAGMEPEEIQKLPSACKRGYDVTWYFDREEIINEIPTDRLRELAQAEKDGRLVVQEPPTPGALVWVIERDEYGELSEISGYMFLAFSRRAVIVSPFINDCETFDETMEYHIEETLENYDTDLAVFPKNDCYLTREEAEAALKKREVDNETD